MSSIISVSQLNKYIQFKIQSDLKLKGVAVKGEISNFSINYKSGHGYFTLKDENSSVKCVMFSRNLEKLKFSPENGINVLIFGNVDVYERDGVYQIIVSNIQPLGIGVLHKGIEQLKEKLSVAGVFEQSKKKQIPYLPKKISVVSSLTGAALQDVINVISRRFPICIIEIYPAQVQGDAASASIVKALKRADKSGADTIILSRGGGSLEDLMPFNTETVALAIYNCNTPIISAVGHETDTTIADYAADLRAPTPSAAAEQAVPNISELISVCDTMRSKLQASILKYFDVIESEIKNYDFSLKINSPIAHLDENLLKFQNLHDKLLHIINTKIQIKSNQLDKFAAQLNTLSPFNVLDRGYSIVSKENSVISSAKQLKSGDEVEIRFRDSTCTAIIN